METINSTGRRKTAVASIFISKGKGNITVNNKDYKEYFTTAGLQYTVNQPLSLVNATEQYDIKVKVTGGGISGQAEAARLAIAKAMCEISPENRAVYKPLSLLTRDPRMVERKKFGHKKARKRFQFSKR